MWEYIIYGLLGLLSYGIGMSLGIHLTKEQNKLDNIKSYNQGWHDCSEWYREKIAEFNGEEGD